MANLPLSITSSTMVWVDSATLGATAYYLCDLSNNHNFPAIKYLNNDWYYLHWCNEKYYSVRWHFLASQHAKFYFGYSFLKSHLNVMK